MSNREQAGLTKIRLTPLRRRVLEDASRHDLVGLPLNEENAAFWLSQKGLLYACQGMNDYFITPAGRAALANGDGE